MVRPNKLEKLEALRGLAAIYVVLHHITLNEKTLLSYIFIEGQAAVILFFVISGFVIYYSSHNSQDRGTFNFKMYFIKRFRRIYPVFLMALLISYLAASYNSHIWLPVKPGELIGNLFNLQDLKRIPGNWVAPYYSNSPLWSLSYEWWFYLLFFPIFKWVKPAMQKYLVLSISVFGFISFYIINNKISITLEYFVIWWSGVELARSWVTHKKINMEAIKSLLLSYGVMIVLLGVQVAIHKGKLRIDDHPVIELRHYLYGIIIIAIGYTWQKLRFIGYKYTLRPFIILAPISYSIYVFHPPLVYKYRLFGFNNQWVNAAIGFICIIILGYIFEVYLQDKINKLTNYIFLRDDEKISTNSLLDSSKLQP